MVVVPIRIEITIDADVITAFNEAALTAPRRVQRAFDRRLVGIRTGVLSAVTQYPPPVRYPILWKSPRQKRAVIRKLRLAGNLPYRRSGMLARGWKTEFRADGAVGQLTLVNTVPYAQFVQGDFAQPFHLNTGWRQVGTVVAEYREIATDTMIDVWGKVAIDPNEGR